MKVETILATKGREVVTVEESDLVLDAVRLLVERNIGSLVVVAGHRPTGIFTERDILRLTATRAHELASLSVGEVMTRDVITAEPNDGLAHVMDVMTESKVRHLPVMEGGRLAGMISIGDVVNALRVTAEEENSHLRSYIQGVG